MQEKRSLKNTNQMLFFYGGLNMKLNVIMPMGGGGTRFGNHGFNVPKPLIEIYGNHFFTGQHSHWLKILRLKALHLLY